MFRAAFLSVLAMTGVMAAPLPVVLWHGMGDTCCNPLSIGRIQQVSHPTNITHTPHISYLMCTINIIIICEQMLVLQMRC